ncbi:Flp pilus assembly protein TadD [Actinoplanes campanulatus]|uniref:Flp pilus assembly protein TadD n=2 Tax=Actinoplanes campanulatus TaxID=113559 RepID=A0A7W5AQW9_9ACTN|nr:Flp pilus assembly protein TadD [Actinoplanes campanulatus]GGN45868.1 hypothetical protein GCM10010109_80500 [Actinoplanes campanulatus]GID41071.1 hypothetical protein Aca09nite_75770 [Actinoplanes campanulatus]
MRFERHGDPSDLEEAIATGRRVVADSPVDHPDRATILANLGCALHSHAELDEAVTVHEQAVRATPPDDPDLAGRLTDLGGAFIARFQLTGARGDLRTAVRVLRKATR